MRVRRHGNSRPPFLTTEDDQEEWVETTPLIRTSEMHDKNITRNREWLKSGTQPDMFTTTAADYTHYVNPTVTTCSTANTAYEYTANSLGLTDSTQA